MSAPDMSRSNTENATSPPSSGTEVERTAALLREHRMVYESDGDYGELNWVECSCGSEYFLATDADEDTHRAHVAAVLDAHYADRERAAAEKALRHIRSKADEYASWYDVSRPRITVTELRTWLDEAARRTDHSDSSCESEGVCDIAGSDVAHKEADR